MSLFLPQIIFVEINFLMKPKFNLIDTEILRGSRSIFIKFILVFLISKPVIASNERVVLHEPMLIIFCFL